MLGRFWADHRWACLLSLALLVIGVVVTPWVLLAAVVPVGWALVKREGSQKQNIPDITDSAEGINPIKPLTGAVLLEKIKDLGNDIGKDDLVRACGYFSKEEDGRESIHHTKFYEALLEAKGVSLGESSITKEATSSEDNQLNENKNIDYEKLWNFFQDGGVIWTKDDTAKIFGYNFVRIIDEYDFVHGIERDPPLSVKSCSDVKDLPRMVNEFIDIGGDIDMINNELEAKEILEDQLENIDYDWLWQYLGVGGGEISSRNGAVWIGSIGPGTIEVNGQREYGISYCKDITDLPRLVKDFIKVGGEITDINKRLNDIIELQKLEEEVQNDVSFNSFICGKEPLSGEFFVGTKSVFNKTDPLICCIPEACDEKYPPAVATKLKWCLKYLPELGIKGVLEGELLFIEPDKKIKIVNGEKLYIITSNNISYGISTKSEMGKRIEESKIGLIFHNHYYEGEDIEGLLSLCEMKPREGMKEDLIDTRDVVVFKKEEINEFKIDKETRSEENK